MSLDLIIFAAVAIFLAIRLRDILGRSDGKDKLDHPFGSLNHPDGKRDEKPGESSAKGKSALDEEEDDFDPSTYDPSKYENDKVVPLPDRGAARGRASARQDALHEDLEINSALLDIRRLDKDFDPKVFLQGAEMAYEMVLKGYADGDLDELAGLMTPQVLRDFKAAIDARADAGETLETTLVGFDKVEIVGANLKGETAELDVLYTTQQINIMRDSEGEMLDEDDAHVVTQQDRWTLIRKVTSRDPNWTLVSLVTVEED